MAISGRTLETLVDCLEYPVPATASHARPPSAAPASLHPAATCAP